MVITSATSCYVFHWLSRWSNTSFSDCETFAEVSGVLTLASTKNTSHIYDLQLDNHNRPHELGPSRTTLCALVSFVNNVSCLWASYYREVETTFFKPERHNERARPPVNALFVAASPRPTLKECAVVNPHFACAAMSRIGKNIEVKHESGQ